MKTILIVEDDDINREVLSLAIQQETPYLALVASDGQAALQVVAHVKPNLFTSTICSQASMAWKSTTGCMLFQSLKRFLPSCSLPFRTLRPKWSKSTCKSSPSPLN
jgi:CheY-like chemotaxis protein